MADSPPIPADAFTRPRRARRRAPPHRSLRGCPRASARRRRGSHDRSPRRSRRRADHRGRRRRAPATPSWTVASGCIAAARRSSSSVRGSRWVSWPPSVPQPRTATVTALEPTLLLRLDKAVLDDLLADWPELAHGVIAVLVGRLSAIAERADREPVTSAPPRGVVGLLTAQALAFGVTLALLVIPANALFLDAYGSEWLPATYIATAVVGSLASIFIARAARQTRLVRLATVSARRARRRVRGVVGDPDRRRRLGLGGPARRVPDRAPAWLRVHRWPGRPAPRRATDEGAVPAHRVGVRRRVLRRRPARGSRSSRCSARPSS